MECTARSSPRVADPIDLLLLQIRDARSRDAFVELFRGMGPRVKAYLVRGGLDLTAAEEVTQEVFLKVWRQAGRFDAERGSAAGWIFTIARNARIDRQRKQRLPRWDRDDPTLVSEEPGPLELAVSRRSDERVRTALGTLPDEQLHVVRAAYFEHRTMREIATDQEVPLGTVKSRMRLALERLRAALAGEEKP